MGKHTKMNLHSLRAARSSAQACGQSTFESRDRTLGLDSLTILDLGKTTVHLSAISRLGPATSAAFVQVDDRAADAQMFACTGMIVLGVVSRVGEKTVDVNSFARASQQRREQRRVLAWAVADPGVNQQMGRVVNRERELGPATQTIAFLADSVGVMRRAVSRFHARGVDAGLLLLADHSLLGGVDEDGIEKSVERTFLRRRCCAL